MTIFGLLIAILIFCLIVWLVRGYAPAPFNPILIYVAVAILLIYLFWALLGGGSINLHTPLHVR